SPGERLVKVGLAQQVDAMVAHVGQVQYKIIGECLLDRHGPGLDVRCPELRVHGTNATRSPGPAGHGRTGGHVPYPDIGAATAYRRRREYRGRCSRDRTIPLHDSENVVARPGPIDRADVSGTARRH